MTTMLQIAAQCLRLPPGHRFFLEGLAVRRQSSRVRSYSGALPGRPGSIICLSQRRWASGSTEPPHGDAPVRVRFAPSPTGFLHLGGLRTALYNFLFARKLGGAFILRLEDTDQSRLVPGAADNIEDMLEWSGIPPDESPRRGGACGPYLQSHRLPLYKEAADRLLQSGHAYRCFCSPQRLELLRREALRRGQTPRYDNRCRHLRAEQLADRLAQGAPSVVRFRLAPGAEPFQDLVYGHTQHDVGQVEGDPVVVKGDGFPTYHLACVVDDHLMGVSHVLRGSEWVVSTSKHLLLYRALGWRPPVFSHLPLLTNPDGSKLSKRQQDLDVRTLRARGWLASSLLDLVTASGSGFSSRRPGRTLDQMVSDFQPSRISAHSALLDLAKLPDINRLHLQRRIDDPQQCDWLAADLRGRVLQTYGTQIQDEAELPLDYITRLLHLRKGHISTLEELLGPDYGYLWVRPSVCVHRVAALSSEAGLVVGLALRRVSAEGCASVEAVARQLKGLSGETRGTRHRDAMQLLRLALSGRAQGPSVAEMMVSLGAAEVAQRLQDLLLRLQPEQTQ